MNSLADLKASIDAIEQTGNFEGLRMLREQIVREHPDTDAAVEATYKLGLDALFRKRDLDAAVALFEEAAKARHVYWSNAARTSLGLCFFHQKRGQKALFELRKVAYAKVQGVHSVVAMGFIESIYASEGNADEAQRVRRDKLAQLEQMVQMSREAADNPGEFGFYLFHLGLGCLDAHDADRARLLLEEAQALGPKALGAELMHSVVQTLAEL